MNAHEPSGDSHRSSAQATKRRFPLSSVVIGVVVGAIVGIALAQGILAIVAWRREVRLQEQDAAATIAAEKMAQERNEREERRSDSDWFRWSTRERKP